MAEADESGVVEAETFEAGADEIDEFTDFFISTGMFDGFGLATVVNVSIQSDSTYLILWLMMLSKVKFSLFFAIPTTFLPISKNV